MGGRSTTLSPEARTRVAQNSAWARYPQILTAIGLALLLVAAVLGFARPSPGHDAHEGAVHEQPASTEAVADPGPPVAADEPVALDEHGGGAHGADTHHGSDGGERFYFSYLTAFMYALSLALGGLFFVVVQFLVKAGWSVVVRRVAENVMGTLPLFVLLFVPVALGLHATHHHWWDVPVGTDALLDAKRGYLNKPFFFFRAMLYFLSWWALARHFRNLSVEQDTSGEHDLTRRLQRSAPVATIVFALTVTFAAIDWMKSMDPHWYSTMWGVYYFAGCLVGIFSLLAVLVIWHQRSGVLVDVVNVEHMHDIGKQMFGFTVFWTYIAFSQYFLIWYANLPEEQLWFEHRSHGGWGEFAVFLGIGHFFLPFFFLLPRAIKRHRVTLFVGAAWLLFVHYLDIYFIVMPMLPGGFSPHVVDGLTVAGVMALFLGAYARLANGAELVPTRDPRLPESLGFENF